jgi:hypothetical protein
MIHIIHNFSGKEVKNPRSFFQTVVTYSITIMKPNGNNDLKNIFMEEKFSIRRTVAEA